MQQIVITGVPPYDGRYDLDGVPFTTREWGWIKRLAGYLPANMDEITFTDPEFVCTYAAILIRRADRIQASEVPAVFEKLADEEFGLAITIEGDPDQEADELPPPRSSTGNGTTSGRVSPANSGSPAVSPSPTGTPASGASASAPVTLAS